MEKKNSFHPDAGRMAAGQRRQTQWGSVSVVFGHQTKYEKKEKQVTLLHHTPHLHNLPFYPFAPKKLETRISR